MLGFIAKLSAVVACSLMVSVSAFADTVEDTTTTTVTQSPSGEKVTKTVQVSRHIVTTPVPAPKDSTSAPVGFANCFTVESGWYNNVWIDRHRVCQYNDEQKEGEVWVAGYWGCTMATTQGICSTWEWTPGHWQKTMAVY